jgi:hypothetical protein
VIVLKDQLEDFGVKVHSDLVLDAIRYGKVAARDAAGAACALAAEAVVLAPNLNSRTGVAAQFLDLAEEVHVIGDCKAPRILFNAIHEGFEAAVSI